MSRRLKTSSRICKAMNLTTRTRTKVKSNPRELLRRRKKVQMGLTVTRELLKTRRVKEILILLTRLLKLKVPKVIIQKTQNPRMQSHRSSTSTVSSMI